MLIVGVYSICFHQRRFHLDRLVKKQSVARHPPTSIQLPPQLPSSHWQPARALRGREQSQEMGWAMMLVAVPNGLKGGKEIKLRGNRRNECRISLTAHSVG